MAKKAAPAEPDPAIVARIREIRAAGGSIVDVRNEFGDAVLANEWRVVLAEESGSRPRGRAAANVRRAEAPRAPAVPPATDGVGPRPRTRATWVSDAIRRAQPE